MEIIGIDEVGRGPLAGPVVVAGVLLRDPKRGPRILRGIKDSKKLSRRAREEWFLVITRNPALSWAVSRVYPSVIDRIHITRAANRAAFSVYRRLASQRLAHAFLDGGLFLPSYIPHTTIIKGDEKIALIAAASIVAKVTRDRYMVRMHRKYPHYRFDLHKGYGTELHRKLLKQFDYSVVHRKSFSFRA